MYFRACCSEANFRAYLLSWQNRFDAVVFDGKFIFRADKPCFIEERLSASGCEVSCLCRVFENERVRYVGREGVAFIRNFGEVTVFFADNDFALGFFSCGEFERFLAEIGQTDKYIERGIGGEFFLAGIRRIQPLFELFGGVAVPPFFVSVRIVFFPNGYVAGHALYGNNFSDFFDSESVFDAVLCPGNDSFVVHPLAVRNEMFLKLGTAPALNERHILVGRKFGFAVGVDAPVPFAAFMPVDALGYVIVAVEGEGDNSPRCFEELSVVHDRVTHFN